jgi:hypothetical protein
VEGLKTLLEDVAAQAKVYDIVDRTEAMIRRRRYLRPAPAATAALVVGVVAVIVLVIGWNAAHRDRAAGEPTWQERADAIDGIVNYHRTDPKVTQSEHRSGRITYEMDPPAAGPHNMIWQNCMGDVYTSPVAKEHAVHSLEHGAVWITYRPDLPRADVRALAARVRDTEYMLMSPYPGMDHAISLQAWGYQLKVDRADDYRIDEFIDALRVNAAYESQANCADGIAEATGTPVDRRPAR